jgi:hypothetical protein
VDELREKGHMNNRFYTCDLIKELEAKPEHWQRVSLTYMSIANPDYLDVRLTAAQTDMDVEGAKAILGKHFYNTCEKKIEQENPEFYSSFLMNLDSTPTTDDWRRLFCGRTFNSSDSDITKHGIGFWDDIFPTL